jgi:phage terminase large subunit
MGRGLHIETPAVYVPLLAPARYKGAHGGRGSGKSHFFAELLCEDALAAPGELGEGLRAVCIREVQKTLAESAKRLIEAKIAKLGLGEADGFKVYEDRIKLPRDGVAIFQGMQDHTAESVKSLEGFHRAWLEEAQAISQTSLTLLRPTIRTPGSQIWAGWNPRRKVDPIDLLLRGTPPTGSIVVKANWRDNPWFPAELEQERLDCLRDDPDQYDHIWEGGYATIVSGAYYAKQLAVMKAEGRLSRVTADPLIRKRAFFDIGGTGAKADACSIWIAQFVGREIRVLDYYEAQGQPLASHVVWLQGKGYLPATTDLYLPHDGATQDKVFAVSYQSALSDAGYDVTVIPNQGKGAASIRIESARRRFGQIWINAPTTEAGVEALGAYHARRDDKRLVDLGPEHDWASHAADAFGMMCVAYEEPNPASLRPRSAYDTFGSSSRTSSWAV